MSTEEILSGLPLWATLPNTSGTVAGTFPQWDGTKWVAVTNGGGGSGDVTQAGNNNFIGSNNFATAPRVAGFDVATVNDLSNVLKLSAPITDHLTFANITDYANNATGLSLTSVYFKSDVNFNGSSGFIVKNSANTGNAIAQLLLQNNAGNVGQIFAASESSVYGANAFVMVQYKDAPMRFVSNTSNAFVFASNLSGTNQYASISNTSIDLNKPTNINSSLAMVNIAEPVGTAGKTTLYSDTSGRLAWKSGTGFTRTFDASSITANRTYTMPNADTTLAGLSVAQTFSAQQIFGAGTYTTGNSFFGSNSAIINSVGKAGFGVNGSLTAQLTVRGDGTNPVARFENSTGSQAILINSLGDTIYGSNNYINIRANLQGGSGPAVSIGSFNSLNATSGTQWVAETIGTFASGAGSSVKYLHAFNYTINNSGAQTGTATGIFLNATETALNGMTHNLMDLQVNGVSKFKISNSSSMVISAVNATTITGGNVFSFGVIGSNTKGYFYFPSDGVVTALNSAGTDFNRLQFGGTGATRPALKVNGIELQARLADDSGYGNFAAGIYTAYNKTNLAPSTASYASLNIKSGTTPTTPIDGDIWNDGTDLYMRIAGATKRFSFVA